MRLLADENLPRRVFEALDASGHDVRWIGGKTSGITDTAVLALAQTERRTILTFDADFGKLIILDNLPGYCGVILFRIQDLPPDKYSAFIINILNNPDNIFVGYFTVVKTGEIRKHPLSGGPC